jgi:hypothetical protein
VTLIGQTAETAAAELTLYDPGEHGLPGCGCRSPPPGHGHLFRPVQTKADGLNRLGQVDGTVLVLIGTHESDQDVEPIASRRPFGGAPKPLDILQRLLVVWVASNGLNPHSTPSSRQSKLTILAVAYDRFTSAEVLHDARRTSWNQASRAPFTEGWDLRPDQDATNRDIVLLAITRNL